MVVRDSIVASELGTYANPIVIADELPPLGSTSNSILTQVDENRCGVEPDKLASNPNAEMAPMEFWGSRTDRNFAGSVKDDVATDTSPVYVPSGSLRCENLEGLRAKEKSTPKGFQSYHKALNITEDSFHAPFSSLKGESTASDHGGTLR